MAEFPFRLLIKPGFSKNKGESLTCTALLRVIPGRRQIYDGLWNGQGEGSSKKIAKWEPAKETQHGVPVIVKVFSHKISAKRHLKREWRGLSKLAKHGLSSPEPLFYGKTEDGRWAMVAEKIIDSSTALDVLNETTEKSKKLDLLILICRELAKQHDRGVLQKDLHLGNFLLGGKGTELGKVFAIDPGQMRFFSHQITKKKSISQLASLACCLPASDTDSIARLCEEYFKARGWHFGKSDMALLQKQLTVHRKMGVKRGLKKCLRTSKRHLRIKADGHVGVFDRGFCQGTESLDFIKRIDALMDAGKILKNGNTCYVSEISWNGKNIVAKRYNHKGFIHSLRCTIKKSRAHRGWLHAHRLRMLNIPTPRPLAFIERRRGMLVWKSYFVTEYVEGQKLYDFLRNSKIGEEERSKVIQQLAELLDKLDKHRISHGDLKHSNILITDNMPVLTDLDAVRAHRCNWIYQRFRKKDLARLVKNWPQDTVSPDLFTEKLGRKK